MHFLKAEFLKLLDMSFPIIHGRDNLVNGRISLKTKSRQWWYRENRLCLSLSKCGAPGPGAVNALGFPGPGADTSATWATGQGPLWWVSWSPGKGTIGHQTLLCLAPDPLFMVPKLGTTFLLEQGLGEKGWGESTDQSSHCFPSGPHHPWLAVAVTNFIKILWTNQISISLTLYILPFAPVKFPGLFFLIDSV